MNSWNNYMYNLLQRIEEQDRKIRSLESRVEKFEQKESNQNNIEKIEYHFDQLKIENLDGTLHIGLSPNDLKDIEDLSVPPGKTPVKQQLLSDLNRYLKEHGSNLIRNIADQNHFSIDNTDPSILIEDMAKQLPERITFYEEESKRKNQNLSEDQRKQFIMEQIKHEIHHSLTTYMERNDSENEYGSS
ncbi:spore germination protein GerPC [Virgibacillus salinus]|uniref:Spore germination protein PC n=1 Tax=Virgibacillus salinus TaxID=553311 RepID=A0A1H1EEY3_9BACI|nr:spore germination protein GerPC [Virgibacillus salinus]SDQ87345.1 spore germination protein PC [Virgibacillus salinus]